MGWITLGLGLALMGCAWLVGWSMGRASGFDEGLKHSTDGWRYIHGMAIAPTMTDDDVASAAAKILRDRETGNAR